MRTTLTLDDDVAAALEHLREERHTTFRHVVNDALRAGVRTLEEGTPATRPQRTVPMDLGEPYLPNLDNYTEVLAYAEGEDFK